MLRHRVKRNEKSAAIFGVVSVAGDSGATRLQKIDAMVRFGRKIGKKANSQRVNSAFDEVYSRAVSDARFSDEQRRDRNRRKRIRRSKRV